MLSDNPGMPFGTASLLAEATLDRYPTLISHTADWNPLNYGHSQSQTDGLITQRVKEHVRTVLHAPRNPGGQHPQPEPPTDQDRQDDPGQGDGAPRQQRTNAPAGQHKVGPGQRHIDRHRQPYKDIGTNLQQQFPAATQRVKDLGGQIRQKVLPTPPVTPPVATPAPTPVAPMSVLPPVVPRPPEPEAEEDTEGLEPLPQQKVPRVQMDEHGQISLARRATGNH